MKSILLILSICTTTLAAAQPMTLWDSTSPVPKVAEILQVEGVRHEVIKERDPEKDGYSWLHGVALAWWGDRLYASFGLNKGKENTVTEVAGITWSEDDGKTWSEVEILDPGTQDLAVSHGVFLSTESSPLGLSRSLYGKAGECACARLPFGSWRGQVGIAWSRGTGEFLADGGARSDGRRQLDDGRFPGRRSLW